MSLLRSGGVRLKPKLTLRSLSELSRLRVRTSDVDVADGSAVDRAVLAQRVVCAMRRGEDKELSDRQD